jgi:hypothetical protein
MQGRDPKAKALAEADKIESRHKLFFWMTVAIEAALIAGFLLVMDFKNSTHVLLLFSSMALYSTVALGMAGLNLQLQASQRRLLEALNLRSEL